MLLFTPGALLQNGRNNVSPAWEEVTLNGEINSEAYYQLYARRLLPPFLYANELAKQKETMACITIPGLGCGQFAGKFHGRLGDELKTTLTTLPIQPKISPKIAKQLIQQDVLNVC